MDRIRPMPPLHPFLIGDCVIELTNKTSWRVEAVLDWFRKKKKSFYNYIITI